MSNKITINIINAFTDAGEGGNPAGVVYPADEFSSEVKQRIAAKTPVLLKKKMKMDVMGNARTHLVLVLPLATFLPCPSKPSWYSMTMQFS